MPKGLRGFPAGPDRAKANREQRQKALREELQGREYLRQIKRLLVADYGGDSGAVSEARFKVDGYMRLLAKVLPDLKAVEVTGQGGGPIKFENATDAELLSYAQQLGEDLGVDIGPVGTEATTH